MSGQEITRIGVTLIAKGTNKVEAQVNKDLKRADPDLEIGKGIIERALEDRRDEKDGDSSSIG